MLTLFGCLQPCNKLKATNFLVKLYDMTKFGRYTLLALFHHSTTNIQFVFISYCINTKRFFLNLKNILDCVHSVSLSLCVCVCVCVCGNTGILAIVKE